MRRGDGSGEISKQNREVIANCRLPIEEEADETAFWLELITDSNIRGKAQIEPLLKEASELVPIMAASAIGNRKSAVS